MSIKFKIWDVIPASPEEVYDAWLDSEKHGAMTGGTAEIDAVIGGSFTAWDGYISGKNIELKWPGLIIQSWRTSEFADSEPDSRLEVQFEPDSGGTKITITHYNLPPHGGQYEQGWIDNYFDPMKEYF